MISYDDLTREEMISLLAAQQSTVQELLARVSQLEALLNQRNGPSSGGPPSAGSARTVPHFVKPNTKSKDSVRRKKRSQSFVRKREFPTETVQHFPDHCSHCQRKLSGGSQHSSRQVLEIPHSPIRIIEHQFMACKCRVCGHREIARPNLSDVAIGKSRFGIYSGELNRSPL